MNENTPNHRYARSAAARDTPAPSWPNSSAGNEIDELAEHHGVRALAARLAEHGVELRLLPASASSDDLDGEDGALWLDTSDQDALVVAPPITVDELLWAGARLLAMLDGAPVSRSGEPAARQQAADVALEAMGLAYCNQLGAPWVAVDLCETAVRMCETAVECSRVLPVDLAADVFAALTAVADRDTRNSLVARIRHVRPALAAAMDEFARGLGWGPVDTPQRANALYSVLLDAA